MNQKEKSKPIDKLRVGTVFSGIGAAEQALKRLGIPHEIVFACDNGNISLEDISTSNEINNILKLSPQEQINKVESIYLKSKKTNYVKKSYLANYDIDQKKFYNDIRFLGNHINKEIDILIGGSPCQSFSSIGNRGGFNDTRGTLFFEFARCLKEFQPSIFIFENVKGLITHDKGKTFEIIKNTFIELNYDIHFKILNAKDFNLPQNRQRIFVVGFKNKRPTFNFPEPIQLNYTMGDFLFGNHDAPTSEFFGKINFNDFSILEHTENNDFPIDLSKYFLSEKLINNYIMVKNKNGKGLNPTINTPIAKTLLASMHKQHRATQDNYITSNGKLRRLTPRESLRLMGFPDTFKQVVSDLQMYKQAGNSIAVDVLMALLKQIYLKS